MTRREFVWRLQFAHRLAGIVLRQPLVGPLRVLLEITHHCNLRCSFCESHGSLQPTPITARRQYAGDRRSMSLDAIAVLCRSLARLRAGRVQLSGKGDPMAHPQLAEIVRIIKQARLGCTLVTNGTLGQADLAASLVESRLDHLNVSLNAASPEVYARIAGKNLWESVIGFLREVIERRRAAGAQLPRIGTSYVLCRDNAEDVERMIDLCCELHLDEIRWSVMGELPETRQLQLGAEQFSRLLAGIAGSSRRLEAAGVSHNLRQLATDLRLRPGIHSQQENPLQRRLPCYEGWMFTAIGPDGTVVPCCACENVRLGNVEDEDFSEVWHGARYRDFRRRSLAMPRVGQPICWECFTTCNRAQDNERIHRWLGPLRPR